MSIQPRLGKITLSVRAVENRSISAPYLLGAFQRAQLTDVLQAIRLAVADNFSERSPSPGRKVHGRKQ